MLAANVSGRPIHRCGPHIAQRAADVLLLSEGTLGMLKYGSVEGLRLCGRNIAAPQRLMAVFAMRSSGATRRCLGPCCSQERREVQDGSRATCRRQCCVSAYEMHSPKAGIVGETERKTRLQQSLLAQFQPNVAFIDEITEAFPCSARISTATRARAAL